VLVDVERGRVVQADVSLGFDGVPAAATARMRHGLEFLAPDRRTQRQDTDLRTARLGPRADENAAGQGPNAGRRRRPLIERGDGPIRKEGIRWG
jgi:hypothetical protein